MNSASDIKTDRQKITINVNGRDYKVNVGMNLLEACLGLEKDVPYFCWHPTLGSVGSCRQCAVQLYQDAEDDQGRMVMSCMTAVSEGMIVNLDAEQTKKFREQNIEMMMSNHPHDCPVCEEGGECHLQDMTIQSGHTSRDYQGTKKTYENQNLGPCIGHEMNRCIACYRCVRFYNDYAGGNDLAVLGSRENVYFGRHEEGTLESPFSGNLAEVCPTGVFTDKTLSSSYTRKWDLQAAPSICGQCSLGCNITPAERDGRVKRITNRYHGQVNGYFICDRGRFGYAYTNSDERLYQCQVTPEGGEETQCNYAQALDYVAQIFDELGPDNILGLGSPRASVEENVALQSLVGEPNFYAGITETQQQMQRRIIEILANDAVHTPSMKEMESADAVLILGEDLMQSAPRMALAVRQASRNEGLSQASNIGVEHWRDDSVRILAQDQRSPIISINSTGSDLDPICAHSIQLSPAEVVIFAEEITAAIHSGATGSSNPLATSVAGLLLNAKRPLIISGTGSNQPVLIDAAAELAVTLAKTKQQRPWLSYVLEASNSVGLSMLDSASHAGTLQKRLSEVSQPTALIVMQRDLDELLDEKTAKVLTRKCKHLIVLDQLPSTTSAQADVVIAAASMMETDGTLINNEGRSQRYFSVLASSDTTQIDNWRLLSKLAGLIKAADINRPESLSRLAECNVFDDLVTLVSERGGYFRDWDRVAPGSGFRVAGMKVPRQSHRFSGRTSLHAREKVSENKQPVDENSALSFSMEGSPIDRPPALNPLVWMPGWNSNEAINKFQEEINGPLKGGDPGLLLFEPPYTSGSPLEFRQSRSHESEIGQNTVLAVAHARLFDGEALSARSPALRQRSPRPIARINPETARQLNLSSAKAVMACLGEQRFSLPLVQDRKVAQGILILPAQANAPIRAHQLPAQVTVSVSDEGETL